MMRGVLVDTSVWSEHFRQEQQPLIGLLNEGLVVSHELVIEELALSMSARHLLVLHDIAGQETLPGATMEEYLQFVERHAVAGEGIGCVDTHLLISCKLVGAGLWTFDTHLARAADRCGIDVYSP
jgi:predicted nucleic acid-binding protein